MSCLGVILQVRGRDGMSVVAKRLDGSRIKMPLGAEVGLGPDHVVLDGDPAPPPPRKGHHSHCPFKVIDCATAVPVES